MAVLLSCLGSTKLSPAGIATIPSPMASLTAYIDDNGNVIAAPHTDFTMPNHRAMTLDARLQHAGKPTQTPRTIDSPVPNGGKIVLLGGKVHGRMLMASDSQTSATARCDIIHSPILYPRWHHSQALTPIDSTKTRPPAL